MSPSPESSRKRSRTALFEHSGMTEQQRRQVRHKQRCLHEKIEQGNDAPEDETTMVFLSKVRDENNQLFDSVRYTREAVLDANNQELIVEKTLLEVDKLREVARFDAEKLARTLRSKLSGESEQGRHFDWTVLGRECGICFNAPPCGVRFLAGSIDMEGEKVARKARAKRHNAKQDDAAEVRPEVMGKEAAAGDKDALSQAEKDMKNVSKFLKKRANQEFLAKEAENPNADEETKRLLAEHGSEVDGVKFLMNPRSFTQSVENIFNFSFLVKKAGAAVGVRSKLESDQFRRPGLWVRPRKHNGEDEELPQSTQAVISFNMKDWRRICEAHNLEEGDIPHRTGSRHQRAAASQSSQQHE